jgi:hypothetical protein
MPRKDPEARREYHRAYMQRWYEQHRQVHIGRVQVATRRRRALLKEQVNALKRRPCADCGVQYPPFVMDFDHVDGDKVDDICTMRRRLLNWQTIVAEIAKCDVVCSNCHRSRTHFRKLGRTPPGMLLASALGHSFVAIPVPAG